MTGAVTWAKDEAHAGEGLAVPGDKDKAPGAAFIGSEGLVVELRKRSYCCRERDKGSE